MPETPKFSPAALLGLLGSPVVLVLAVLTAIVGALWWFEIVDPVAIAAGVIVLILAAGLFFGGVYLARRRDKRAVDATIAGMTDSISAQDNSPQARERVAKLRAKWERLFKNVRPDYVKSKPILMIMGESKSGKSVLLDRSGLELESGNREERDWEEGTENVDPWFFPDGLVLDTAGEMLVSAAGSARIDWSELVKLIKTLRPRNPVSGVILAVPVWRLQSDDESERIRQANLIQREFQKLVQMFGVRFPVSVVVTMADLVDGYSEFALRQSAARPGDKYTMLGWPQYQLSDEFGGRDVMGESVTGVTSRLEAQVLHDTCNPDTAAVEAVEALEIWSFPRNIRTIGQRLAEYLKLVFKEKQSERVANAPFFRGVFFGSSMQAIRKGEPRRKEPERPRSEPFNIRDLLAIRLFGEAGLVTTSPRAEAAARTRRLVGVVVPLAVAMLSGAIALIAFDLAGRVSRQKAALEAIATRLEGGATTPWIAAVDGGIKIDDGLAGELAKEFAAARDFKVADLPFWLGWYRGFAGARERDAAEVTERAWTKLVAMPLLAAAADERAWLKSEDRGSEDRGREFAYRSLPLEEPAEKNGAAPTLNSKLRTLDQKLVRALKQGGSTRADALRLGGPTPEAGADSGSLDVVLVAMTGSVSARLSTLLNPGEGWRPPESGAKLADAADAMRARFLAEKIVESATPLMLAADTHAAWRRSKVRFDSSDVDSSDVQPDAGRVEDASDQDVDRDIDEEEDDGEEGGEPSNDASDGKADAAAALTAAIAETEALSWGTVKRDLWGELDELGAIDSAPSKRLAAFAAMIDSAQPEARILELFPESKRPRSGLGDAKEPLGKRVAQLDKLYEARNDGYPETIDRVIERIEAVHKAQYAPGTLGAVISFRLEELWEASKPAPAKRSEGASAESGEGGVENADEGEEGSDDPEAARQQKLAPLREYAGPATREFHRSVAQFLETRVAQARLDQGGSPDASRPGVLAPVLDFSGVDAIARKEQFKRDLENLAKWRDARSTKQKRDFKAAFDAASERLTQLSAEAQQSLAGVSVVAKDGFDPGAPRTQALVEAVLQAGSATVADVAGEIAAQGALLAGKSGDEIETARKSASDAAKRNDRAALAAALKSLATSSSGLARNRTDAARWLASFDPISSEGKSSEGKAIADGIAALSALPEDEQRYWSFVFRDLLVLAASFRDDAQRVADELLANTSERFPLDRNASDVASIEEVLEVARDVRPAGDRGSATVDPSRRGRAALADLWQHQPRGADRSDRQRKALEMARIVAGSVAGSEPVALRLTVRATGDWGLLGKFGAVSVIDPNRRQADNANRIKQQVALTMRGSAGQPETMLAVEQDREPADGARMEWALVNKDAQQGDGLAGGMTIQFATGELGEQRTQRPDVVFGGGAWSALRLARELSPISKDAKDLTLHDEFAWGALRVVDAADGAGRERELYVAIGLKLEWVQKDGTTKAVPIGDWLMR